MRVLTYGLGEGGLKCWGGGPGKREGEGGNVKARFECFAAMANALVQYPSLFIPRHKDLIPLILGGLIDGQQGMKVKAGMALCGFMKGRLNWLRETERAVKEVQPKLEVIDNHEPAEKERILAKAKTVIQDWKWARKTIAEAEVTTVVGAIERSPSVHTDELATGNYRQSSSRTSGHLSSLTPNVLNFQMLLAI